MATTHTTTASHTLTLVVDALASIRLAADKLSGLPGTEQHVTALTRLYSSLRDGPYKAAKLAADTAAKAGNPNTGTTPTAAQQADLDAIKAAHAPAPQTVAAAPAPVATPAPAAPPATVGLADMSRDQLEALWTSRGMDLPMGKQSDAALRKHAARQFGMANVPTPAPVHKPTEPTGLYEGKDGRKRLRADAKATLKPGEKLPQHATDAMLLTIVTKHADAQKAAANAPAPQTVAQQPEAKPLTMGSREANLADLVAQARKLSDSDLAQLVALAASMAKGK